MKLHIGCGDIIIPGWTNLDIDNLPGVDINDDARMLSKIPDESCDIIYACHILEHLGRHEIENVLKTWNKKLKKNGMNLFLITNMGIFFKLLIGMKYIL